MQNYPRLHAFSRFLFSSTLLLLSPLFASGPTGHSMPTAAARAFDTRMDRRPTKPFLSLLLNLALWVAGCIAFLGALMILSDIAFVFSIR